MPSADAAMFIPAVDDGWAVLSEPPGSRDLAVPDYWSHSLQRSLRRRDAPRSRTRAHVGVALTAAALGATVGAAAVAEPAAAALRNGDQGAKVRALQRALGITADGIFGPQTARAVTSFKRSQGLPADGIAGHRTLAALGVKRGAAPKQRTSGVPAVKLSRDATIALQTALGVTADGVFGRQSRRALRRYEAAQGLPADGRPDAQVLEQLGVDPAAEAPEAPAAAQGVAAAVEAARSLIGTPYASGGTTPAGFDCSGLTMYAFKQAGIRLPRTSYDQYRVGTRISRSQIQAGDLVFFSTAGSGASHVGVATGPNRVISATTRGVMEHAVSGSYWGSNYVGARRVS